MAELFIVATPIGNLDDITLRAIETLKKVDTIACEDTRHTIKLLNRLEIRKPLISYYAADEKPGIAKILHLLEQDKDVAYVSDAGTPGVSDPGSSLVRAAREAGYKITPIPGASALTTLISVSGVQGKSITFEGFLSPKPGRRASRIAELMAKEESFIIYESPFRIVKTMTDICSVDPERYVVAGREMTKLYEEFITGTAKEVLDNLAERDKIQGEFAVCIYGNNN
ncbi:MAG: 16S rRNA (cytidine(1402)-2'-O)-methyltransferase [Spirochaetia bacterium]|nr:16S rRNA (cytidine(1402)-2'-O)-methyltransferase [Spirochaetia bacterium]